MFLNSVSVGRKLEWTTCLATASKSREVPLLVNAAGDDN